MALRFACVLRTLLWLFSTQKPKKILRASNKTPIKPGPLIFTPKIPVLTVIPKPQFGMTFFAELWCREGHYHKSSPKKSLLKLNHQKKPWQIFPSKKIPEWKISNPRKSFDHLHHLKSRVPHPSLPPLAQGLVITKASTLFFMVAQTMKED